jgi:hypothetical protein
MKATRRDVLALAAGAAAFGALPAGAQTGNEPGDLRAGLNSADFDQVWELVRDRFYDPSLHGLDWQAVKSRYRPQAIAAGSREEAAVAINAMLAELAPPTPITIRRRIRPIISSPTSSPARSSIMASGGCSRTARWPIRGSGRSPKPTARGARS